MARKFEVNSAVGCEVPLAFLIAEKLSELPAFIRLSESQDAAEARKSIVVGISSDSDDSRQFGLDELENSFFWAQIQPLEQDDHQVGDGDTSDVSSESGQFRVRFRRQVRKSEEVDQEFLFFWDSVSAIAKQWHKATRGVSGPRLPLFVREESPMRSPVEEQEAQGEHLTATYIIDWGDSNQ